ncbi:MAG TPA: hypothetical protein VHU85_16890 [Acidimicrobiales bacterium]|nr:hypothetical protein [Acidimicrobiales bacterium]
MAANEGEESGIALDQTAPTVIQPVRPGYQPASTHPAIPGGG